MTTADNPIQYGGEPDTHSCHWFAAFLKSNWPPVAGSLRSGDGFTMVQGSAFWAFVFSSVLVFLSP